MKGVTATALLVLFATSAVGAAELGGCRSMAETIRLLRPLLDKPWSGVSRAEVAAGWPKPLLMEDCESRENECAEIETCHCDRLRYAGRTIAGEAQCSDQFFFAVSSIGKGRFADHLETVALVVSAATKEKLEAEVDAFRNAVGCPETNGHNVVACLVELNITIEPQGGVWSAWIHWKRGLWRRISILEELPTQRAQPDERK